MPINTVALARQMMTPLTSFINSASIDQSAIRMFLEDEYLCGVYFNTEDNFIILSSNGLHWIRHDVCRSIAFKEIAAVKMSDDPSSRSIDLTLGEGELVQLPILNETDGLPDLYRWFEYLAAIASWPTRKDVSQRIAHIESRDDLIEFLSQEQTVSDNYAEGVSVLRSGFPTLWQLKQSNISPDILNHPDTWRLLALFWSINDDIEWE